MNPTRTAIPHIRPPEDRPAAASAQPLISSLELPPTEPITLPVMTLAELSAAISRAQEHPVAPAPDATHSLQPAYVIELAEAVLAPLPIPGPAQYRYAGDDEDIHVLEPPC